MNEISFKLNERTAEFVGALIGDGCLSKYWSKYDKRWRTVVLFTGQWDNDIPYYENVIQKINKEELGYKGYIYHRKDDNSVRFFIGSKKLVLWLHSMGLPIGVKDKIVIPNYIRRNLNLAKACIRGIFNTDGSVYRRYSKAYSKHSKHYKNYAVIQFTMKNKNVIKFVIDILKQSQFRVNQITSDRDYWVCRITSQKDVNRFFNEIATNNSYHSNRYKKIVKNN